jgi:1,4-alpha-glucan branching enzyme
MLPEPLRRVVEARHHDPFEVLGRHPLGEGHVVRALLPGTANAQLVAEDGRRLPMSRIYNTDLFEWQGTDPLPAHYRIFSDDGHGHGREFHDPYAFAPVLGDLDLHLFGEGRHRHAYRFLGARIMSIDGVQGVLFATWAPNAERVSVVGEFNQWDGRRHPMRIRGGGGIWELFIPGLEAGELYKFELRHRDSGAVAIKTDPYGRWFEQRPSTAAVVEPDKRHAWRDTDWLNTRAHRDWLHAPMSIYEVHLGSWQREHAGQFVDYRDLAHRLVDYVLAQGFTHIELLPVTEHPLDASWGYQTTGYFAPTSRFGEPDGLRYFIDYCHQNGIGVLLDWVPAHFPRDAFALARFDGSPLYEHEDPRRGEHRDWGTLIFNYARNEVRSFLISSACYWMEEFHFDGLRVDAVASMLYLDYSRQHGDWVPNVHGGRENLEAISFLRELNAAVHEQYPGALTMAEESTAWPMVSRPIEMGGLGFSMKWNMGWMNDTLVYMHKEPVHRKYHHNQLTFGLLYAFSENFILPFSHDEVVHMKRSMLDKMPGDDWQRFANLRLLYTYMYTMPGKKLLFMGNEFAQGREWNHDTSLDWHLLEFAQHEGVQSLVRDLNKLHRKSIALHRHDFEPEGFEWIDCNDADHSILSFLRKGGEEVVIVALNFTPVPRNIYRIGIPVPGSYEVVLNSDSEFYGGSNAGTGAVRHTDPIPWAGRDHSLVLSLPPLGGLVMRRRRH